jgi:hypothetical protein
MDRKASPKFQGVNEIMSERIQKEEFVCRLAVRMKTSDAVSAIWLDAVLYTLYKSFKTGQSVALSGFGNFYVCPERERWSSNSILHKGSARSSAGHQPIKDELRARMS